MSVVSIAPRQMSWQASVTGANVPEALALNRETVRDVLLGLRETHGDPSTGRWMSQEDAARRVGGITSRSWQRWESLERTPRRPNLEAIAEAFGFPVERFYDDEYEEATATASETTNDLRELRTEIEELHRKIDILLNR
jgi:Helix-turn-helix